MNNFGIKQELQKNICNCFVKYSSIQKAVIFDSRAKGNYKESSDIDIALYGNISHNDFIAILSSIDDLPTALSFDILLFSTITNQKLKEHIDRVGVVFYEKIN